MKTSVANLFAAASSSSFSSTSSSSSLSSFSSHGERSGARGLPPLSSMEAIDFLCGNEVALYHHTGMLLSLVRADTRLKGGLIRMAEEELRASFCRDGFSMELRQADNDAALRLNLRTAANLDLLKTIFDKALRQWVISKGDPRSGPEPRLP